jgi:hypothetical protein
MQRYKLHEWAKLTDFGGKTVLSSYEEKNFDKTILFSS